MGQTFFEAVQREDQQQQRADGESAIATGDDVFAREMVRGVASGKKQQDAGKELRQSHEPQVERAVSESEDLPCHRDRLHLRRGGDEETRQHEVAEVGIAKSDAWWERRGICRKGQLPG